MSSGLEARLKDAFKLNSYESRVYLALLRRSMGAKELSAAARVPLPRVYDTLRSLAGKGFVLRAGDLYKAVEPSVALDSRLASFSTAFQEEQNQREVMKEKITEELQSAYHARGESFDAPVLLDGMESIGTAFLQILRGSTDVIFLIRKAMKVKDVFKSFMETSGGRRRVRVLIPGGARLDEADIAFARKHGIEIKRFDQPLLDMMVADEKDVVLGVPGPSGDEPFSAVAVWIRNPSFAASTRKALEETWNRG